MSNGKVFEYVILFHDKPTKVGDDVVQAPSVLLVDVKRVVATSDKSVAIMAAREIPEEYVDRLDQIEVCVRPF